MNCYLYSFMRDVFLRYSDSKVDFELSPYLIHSTLCLPLFLFNCDSGTTHVISMWLCLFEHSYLYISILPYLLIPSLWGASTVRLPSLWPATGNYTSYWCVCCVVLNERSCVCYPHCGRFIGMIPYCFVVCVCVVYVNALPVRRRNYCQICISLTLSWPKC